ncbi:hypothetical protein G7Y41_07145 [Schaalia sp. ZJ405]|uniref:hypothetical protein n=1 Tax=Schaalia sp. ZJ405 TaxID=2709403 RepID=UPI0013ED073E|nr:hypothetical protein [Schaalia sp. ZJ405]QPK80829.1 hypothetical protein G7Y41_07145 [Schaalia sp. ZJ405]
MITALNPVFDFFTDPRLATELVSLGVVIIGVVKLFFVGLEKRMTSRLSAIHKTAGDGARAAETAKEQTTNSHGTNLRDDLDEVKKIAQNALNNTAQIMERQESDADLDEHRFRRLESQVDGVRDDQRSLTESAAREHQIIHARIDDVKGVCPAFQHGNTSC